MVKANRMPAHLSAAIAAAQAAKKGAIVVNARARTRKAKAPALIAASMWRASHAIVIGLPIRVVSEANAHEHWRVRKKRVDAQHRAVALAIGSVPPPSAPLMVTLTRLAPRRLDSDNAVGSMKHVRDAIAKWFGIDDAREDLVEYVVKQEASKAYGVWVEIGRRGQ